MALPIDFVGRQRERSLVRDLLSTRQSVPFLVYVQGIPGVGKSALLDVLASDARTLGYAVHVVGGDQSSTHRSQEVAKRLLPARKKTLVVVDDWDSIGAGEPVLVDALEKTTGPLVLLVGSRARPRSFFLESALFPDRVRVIEIGGLSEAESVELLTSRGLSPADAARAHHECAGQPFALLLLASMPGLVAQPTHASAKSLALDVVRRLVGQIDVPHMTEALELLSLAGDLNERELRLCLGVSAEMARTMFERLRELMIVRTTGTGLALHQLVSSGLVADLLLRDPIRARSLVAKILNVIEESLPWSGVPRARGLSQLRALAANAPQDPALAKMFELGNMRVTQARERERGDALDLVESLEGREARAIAERFIAHDPASITVVRGATAVDGVMIRIEFRGREIPHALREPALERLVEVLAERGELEPGMLIRVTRFFLARGHHQTPCFELGVLGAAITHRTLETHEPFVTVQVLESRAVDAWRGLMETMGFVARDDAAVEVGNRRLVPCVAQFADLGEVFLGVVRRSWGVSAAAPAPAPASALPEPLPTDLEREVVRALGHMSDPLWLRTCPLAASLFGAVDERERGEHLQAWLADAVAATENMRRGELVARALRSSFEATRSLEEGASLARMGLSTFKRYRKLGVQRIVELARESHAAAAVPTRP